MSYEIEQAVIKCASHVKGPKRLLLVILARHANKDGECWPSIDFLASEVNASRRTVSRQLRALEADGVLLTETKKGRSKLSVFTVVPDGKPATVKHDISDQENMTVQVDKTCHSLSENMTVLTPLSIYEKQKNIEYKGIVSNSRETPEITIPDSIETQSKIEWALAKVCGFGGFYWESLEERNKSKIISAAAAIARCEPDMTPDQLSEAIELTVTLENFKAVSRFNDFPHPSQVVQYWPLLRQRAAASKPKTRAEIYEEMQRAKGKVSRALLFAQESSEAKGGAHVAH